jgi:hypothetical protein
MKRTISYSVLILAILISLPFWMIFTVSAIPQIFNTLFLSPQEQFGVFAFLQVFDYTITVVGVLINNVVPIVGILVSTYFLIVSLRNKDLYSLKLAHHAMWLKSVITIFGVLIASLMTGADAAMLLFGNPMSLGFFVLAPALSLVGLLITPKTKEREQ